MKDLQRWLPYTEVLGRCKRTNVDLIPTSRCFEWGRVAALCIPRYGADWTVYATSLRIGRVLSNLKRCNLMKKLCFLLILLLTSAGATTPVGPPDWPQWHGPDRTAISTETGLLKTWPAKGPDVLWTIADLGEGYGSVAIKGDRIYVQGVKDRQSSIFCLNRADGKTVWVTP